jgi:carboxymethylenebutenolidase
MPKLTVLALTLAVASASPTQKAAQPSRADTVVVQSGPLALHGLLWRPSGPGPHPAVLFNHGSGPSSDPTKPAALGATFARHGYVFLYLYRRGAGLSTDQGTDSEKLMKAALAEKGPEGRNELQLQLLESELSDVLAGLAFLRSRSDVDARQLAVVGHSFGAQLTLLLAARDASIRAAVVFGAAAVSWESSPKLRARLLAAVDQARAPIFFIHAANDYSVEPGKALAAEMARLGKPNLLKIYPAVGQTAGEGHNFVQLGLSTWERDVFEFLEKARRP